MLGLAAIEVTDERGGEYQVFPGGASGGERAWSGETNIIPAPTSGAAVLRVTVTGFDSFQPGFLASGQNRPNHGRWAFEVALGH